MKNTNEHTALLRAFIDITLLIYCISCAISGGLPSQVITSYLLGFLGSHIPDIEDPDSRMGKTFSHTSGILSVLTDKVTIFNSLIIMIPLAIGFFMVPFLKGFIIGYALRLTYGFFVADTYVLPVKKAIGHPINKPGLMTIAFFIVNIAIVLLFLPYYSERIAMIAGS